MQTVKLKTRLKSAFNSLHPRDADGRFAEKGGTVISSNSSTGEVKRNGDFVEKNLVLPNGKKTLEGSVYRALQGVDGIAQGETIGDKVKIPYYKNIISVDDIPEAKRGMFSHVVSKNMDRINSAVSALTNAGFSYSDPLQFGVGRDGKMDLLDFSNSSKPTDDRRINDLPSENFNLLSNFYKSFGLDKQAGIVSKGIALKDLAKSYESDDITDYEDFIGEDFKALQEIRKSGVKANNLYYTSNARAVQLKTVGQTDVRNGVKYIVSEIPLSKQDQDSFELHPIFEKIEKKQVKTVGRINQNAVQKLKKKVREYANRKASS